jgi:hypothetical protein
MNVKELLSHRFLSDKHQVNGPLLTLDEMISMFKRPLDLEAEPNGTVKKFINTKFFENFQKALHDQELKGKVDFYVKANPFIGVSDKRIVDIANELDVMPILLLKKIKSFIE